MSRMITTSPNPPLGAYPQFLLWGHAGIAPNNIKIKITKTIVPNISISFMLISKDQFTLLVAY